MNIKNILLSALLLLASIACNRVEKSGGDLRPQISFEALNLSVEQKKSVKIPVKIQVAPTQEMKIQYNISGSEGIEKDFEITPSEITFSPDKLTDTLLLINKSERQDPETIMISLGEVPSSYRKGIVDFVRLELQGQRPQTISFVNKENDLFRERPIQVMWRDENGRNKRFRREETYPIEVDTQGSTAIEGVHFTFPRGKQLIFEKGSRALGHLYIRVLKFMEGSDIIKIDIPRTDGVAGGTQGATIIKISTPPSMVGTWVFDKFVNGNDYSDAGEPETSEIKKITGEEGDKIVISDTAQGLQLQAHFKGTLRYLLSGTHPMRLERELYVNLRSLYIAYLVDNVNVHVSPLSSKERSAEIGFATATDDKTGDEYLYMLPYDIEPTHYFSMTYSFFVAPGVKYPMLDMPPLYRFKKQK